MSEIPDACTGGHGARNTTGRLPRDHRRPSRGRNQWILAACCLLLAYAYPAFPQSRKQPKLFLVCGDSKVVIVDYNKSRDSIPEVVWSWDAHQARDLPEPYRSKKFNTIDDCKPVRDGKQLLVSSSSGAIVLLDLPSAKVIFYASVPNAHSIEILPGNRLVAAASTAKNGNKIMLFDIGNEKPLATDSLYSAHGLVWNDKTNTLFALGFDVLREYEVGTSGSLRLLRSWPIPGRGGHDLQPAPDGKRLFLTEHDGCWEFDISAHKFRKIPGFPDRGNVKSIGLDASGQYIMTIPEESWWTFHVRFLNPARKMAFPGWKVYKARWFTGKWRGGK